MSAVAQRASRSWWRTSGAPRSNLGRPTFHVRAPHFALALLAASALARPAAASEPEIAGPGMRSAALAGAGASFSDDYEAVYANPAGLAFARTRRLGVGFVAARFQLRLDGAPRPVDDANGLYIGAQLPMPFGGVLADRVVLGLLLYVPLNVVNRAHNPFPDQPSLAVLENRLQTVSVMMAVGVRLHRTLSVGAGALALAALVGEIDLGTDATAHFTTRSNEQLIASYAPLAGVRYEPGRGVRLGLALRGESVARYDLAVKSDLSSVLKLFNLPTLRFAGLAQYDPLQLAFEASWQPSEAWLLAAGLTYARWSAFPVPAEWATPPPEGTPIPLPPDFHDTVTPRAAVEYRARSGALTTCVRLGYAFVQSPAPTGKDRVQLDAHRHVAALGLDFSVDNPHAPLHFTGFWQWHQLQSDDRLGRAAGSFAIVGLNVGTDL